MTKREADRQIEGETGKKKTTFDKKKDREMRGKETATKSRQIERQTNKQIDGQICRQIDQ